MKKAVGAFNRFTGKAYAEILLYANDKAIASGSVLGAMILAASPVFAEGDLQSTLTTSFGKIYAFLIAIAPAIALAAYATAKIWQMVVPEKQGRAEPREWARSALVNYALILAAGAILTFIYNTVTGSGGN